MQEGSIGKGVHPGPEGQSSGGQHEKSRSKGF